MHTKGKSPAASDGHDEYSLAELARRARGFARLCWQDRSRFVRYLVVLIIITLLYIFGSKREYEVTTSILPYAPDYGMLGGLGSLAGLTGLNLPADLPGRVVSAELYPEIANTFAFRSRLASQPLTFLSGVHTFASYFESIYAKSMNEKVVKYVLLLPFTAYEAARERFAPRGGHAGSAGLRLDSLGLARPSPAYVKIIEEMKNRVHTNMNRRTGVISVRVRMPDPYAAADLARLTARQLTADITAFESRKAAEQARFLLEQKLEAEARFDRAQRSLAEFQDRNRNLVSALRRVQLQRLEADFARASTVYENFTAQYESARVKQQEDTPVLTIIEPAVVPNRPAAPRKLALLAFAIITALVLAALHTMLRHDAFGARVDDEATPPAAT